MATSMVASAILFDMERNASAQEEPRIVLYDVSFDQYSALRDAFDEPSLRMTYCEGVLELMSPSDTHERWKTNAARLIEYWSMLIRSPINGYGSTTFRKRAKDRGLEPDECYAVGRIKPEGDVPDIVLEIVYSRPALDKLVVYDGLGVPEVWFFEKGAFTVHRRRPRGGYRIVERSTFLPGIDLKLLARLTLVESQPDALEELERHVRRK